MKLSACGTLKKNSIGQNWLHAGYSMIEANVAMAMVGAFVSAMALVSGNMMGIVKAMKESTASSQCLQERVEQMRMANWSQITDADYIAQNLTPWNESSNGLAEAEETITITPYPDTGTTSVAKVKRKRASTQVLNTSSSLENARMIQVHITLTWRGIEKRLHTRAATTLIAKGGITK